MEMIRKDLSGETTKRSARILIVEDDLTMEPLWSYVISTVVTGASVHWLSTEEAAEKLISNKLRLNEEFDLVIADVFLSGTRTGIDLWRRFGEGPTLFLLMSVVSPQKFTRLVGEGELSPFYIQKPLSPKICIEMVSALLAFRSLIP